MQFANLRMTMLLALQDVDLAAIAGSARSRCFS